MIIEKNNLDIPEYLNKEFFEKTLKTKLSSENIEIKSLNFTLGSGGGDNYCSFIYRVEVVYVQDDSLPKLIFFIVKSIPYDGPREIFLEKNVYAKERQMYVDILPKIENCLIDIKIAPEIYYTTSNPTDTIVFEDMNVSGYSVADRVTGLDEEHSKLVLNKLGQFHAASLLLLEKDPSIRNLDGLKQGLFNKLNMKKSSENYLIKNLVEVIKHSQKWSGYETITTKLQNLVESEFVERTRRSLTITDSDIVVINHGDMWVNNFLFKYLDGSESPTDAVLIDFQGSCFGSLGVDLNYFLATSPKLDVLISKRHELIENGYYAPFRSALETGGYKNIPTLDDIKNEIRKKTFFGFFSSIIILPLISMSKKDSANNSIENFVDKELLEKQTTIACSSERFLETVKFSLKKFDALGILD